MTKVLNWTVDATGCTVRTTVCSALRVRYRQTFAVLQSDLEKKYTDSEQPEADAEKLGRTNTVKMVSLKQKTTIL